LTAGLLAHALESAYGDPHCRFARLTVDLFRAAPLFPLSTTTRVVRDGSRLKAVDASLHADGLQVARASALLLRAGPSPLGRTWTGPPWSAPPPSAFTGNGGPEDGMEIRRVTGLSPGRVERGAVWLREVRQLVEGAPLTPFVRAALAADLVSPLSNWSDRGLHHINADLTLYLHRLPAGEWIGLEVTSNHADAGISTSQCTMYDETGVVGNSTASALATSGLPEVHLVAR
jgi:hypothetical protein